MVSDPRTLARGLRAIAQQPTGTLTTQDTDQAPDVQKWARGLRAISQTVTKTGGTDGGT